MKYFLIAITICITSFEAHSQKLPAGDWKIFDADILGSIYISNGMVLKKINTEGKVIVEYQNQLLGDITHIDCYKGLKILVFHALTNNVVLLNNQLAPVGITINLDKGNMFDVAAVCLGTDDNIWIADEQDGQIKLADQSLNIIQKGIIYRQYTSAEKIIQFAQRGNRIIMVTSDNELLLLDQFGSFVNKHTFKALDYSWIGNEKLYYLSDNKSMSFSYKWSSFDSIISINQSTNAILESKNQLYLLEENRITKLKK
jgi:hypothetical protein